MLPVLGAVGSTAAAPPTDLWPQPLGIYALDSGNGTMTNGYSLRDANIRTSSFVSGYMLRAPWKQYEPEQVQFDFTIAMAVNIWREI